MKDYRVLITGSRNWSDKNRIDECIVWELLYCTLNDLNLVIIHGDCPTGADAMAQAYCEDHGITTERYPADWNKHGKAAGPLRNQKMVDLGADRCIAFLMEGSRGTKDCIRKAQDAGINTYICLGDVLS